MTDKIIDIQNKLIKANDAYRNGRPIMTDAQFDALEDSLKSIDSSNEWFKNGVNDKEPKKRKIKLPLPMMSLDKHKTIESLISWASKYENATFVITPKFDGLSVGFNGLLSWTRGNGIIGQDCSLQLNYVNNSAQLSNDNIIRGEIIIKNSDWVKFKELHNDSTSPRNSATGLINGDFDTSRIKDYELLTVIPYEICGSNESKINQLNYLNNQLYEYIDNIEVLTDEYLLELFLRWKKNYPIDGLVIDVNEPKYRNETEANGNPSYSIAYKSPNFSESGFGVIKDIELNINRNGIVTPVAILQEPIFLSGALINRVNAINMSYVMSWGIVPNESVQIVRSGEVIPKIISVGTVDIPFRETYSKNSDYEKDYSERLAQRTKEIIDNNVVVPNYLSFCPKCGTKLVKQVNDLGEYCDMYCPNENCYGKRIEEAIKFFSICQIDGFGDKKIAQIANEFIKSDKPIFFELLNVDENFLIQFEGWAEISVKSYINECNKIKTNLPFSRFLHATGWFGELGEKTLQKILDSDGWDMTIDELITIEGIQTKTANTFINGKEIYKSCLH
jgi:DNA ligase (NAD+)